MPITHRLDERNIEAAWKRADTSEIEALEKTLRQTAREHGVDLDFSHALYLAFRCGFKAAIG